MAERQGYQLRRSRRRDPRAYDYGGFMIVQAGTNMVEAGGHPHGFSMNIDEVEAWLTTPIV